MDITLLYCGIARFALLMHATYYYYYYCTIQCTQTDYEWFTTRVKKNPCLKKPNQGGFGV